MSMWDPFSPASYGVVPIGSNYPTMSPIGRVGAEGRPGVGIFHPANPALAAGVIVGLTMLGLFAASYSGQIKLGPFHAAGSAGAGK